METVIVFGGSGLLGHTLAKRLSDSYCVVKPTRDEFDIETEYLDVERFITAYKPKYIVNCAGILVSEAANNPQRAAIINTVFPQHLGHTCSVMGVKFLHFSTNCVFQGTEDVRWIDSQKVPDANEVYGRTKAGGESSSYITVRASFIGYSFRRNDTGLFNWFFNSESTIKGYSVLWNGVTTLDIADHISFLMNLKPGIYHFADKDFISKADLLGICNYVSNMGKNIIPVNGGGNCKILRPSWSDLHLPPWEVRIERLLGTM